MIMKLLSTGEGIIQFGVNFWVKFYLSESYEKKCVENAIFDNKSIRLAVCHKADDTYIGVVFYIDINISN